MNLALRGTEDYFGPGCANTISCGFHPAPRSDYILANGRMSPNQSGVGDILGYHSRNLATQLDSLLPKLLIGESSVTRTRS
jgi:hypothetical protein